MTSPHPTPDIDYVVRAIEEFKELRRHLLLSQDEARQFREQLSEQHNLNALLREEKDRLLKDLQTERLRSARWMTHSAKLIAHVEMISTLGQNLRASALEAAQSLATRDLERSLTPDELSALQKLAAGPPSVPSTPETPKTTNGTGTSSALPANLLRERTP